MKKISTIFMAAIVCCFMLVACKGDNKIQGKWNYEKVCINGQCEEIPEGVTAYMDLQDNGVMVTVSEIGQSQTAKWEYDGEYLLTDNGMVQERLHVDKLTDQELVVTGSGNGMTVTMTLHR